MEKQYYWDLLSQAGQIEQEQFAHNIPVQTETQNLKCFAFTGLIRNGELFQIESNRQEIEKLQQENKKKIISSTDIKIPELSEHIKIRSMDGTVYALPLDVLKNHMKSEFDTLIYRKETKSAIAYEELSVELPDIFSDEENDPEPVTEEIPVKAVLKPQTDKLRDENYIPSLDGDMRYNKDQAQSKTLDSFCVDHARMTYEEDGRKAIVDFNVFPLKFVEDAPITDIMVVALSGNIVRAGISRGASSAVQIDFDEMSFMVRGRWESGKFNVKINCLDNRFAEKFQQTDTMYMPTNRTYTIFMQEELEHKLYSFFPATIRKNDMQGLAPAAMVYQEAGDLKIVLSNDMDSFNMIDKDGLPYKVQFYWSGGRQPKLQMQILEE